MSADPNPRDREDQLKPLVEGKQPKVRASEQLPPKRTEKASIDSEQHTREEDGSVPSEND